MSDSRTHQLQIRTPEGIVFSLMLASPVSRCLAWIVDFGCVMAILLVVRKLIDLVVVFNPDVASALGLMIYFVTTLAYNIVLEWGWRGQTVGKRLVRLRVMDLGGLRLTFSQIVMRNVLRMVDHLPVFYLIGGIACLVSRHGQRLGDLAANTIVVRHPRISEPDLDQIPADKYNSFQDTPHLAARLRQAVSPAEAALAVQALLQRESLDPAARLDLFAALADHFRQKVEFPQEATDGLSDEHYLRNVIDIIFRLRGRPAAKAQAPSADS
jgi:uncharacterized RDD family membrane protein YckC